MTTLALLSAGRDVARQYRRNGWWRDGTFLDDLAEWVRVRPDAPAYVTGRTRPGPGDGAVGVLTYQEFAEHVQRFAGGLHDLGVRAGDVVAFQLPDWWETAALLLATMRVGAIAQPMVPEMRSREIERALRRTRARVFVTVDEWAGFDHSQAVAELARRLPALEHRVVYGDAARTGARGFHDCFSGRVDHPGLPALSTLDPDRPCLVLFTSGSTGESKGVLHSFNTIYAGTKGFTTAVTASAPGVDRAAATLRVSHIAGPLWMVFGTLISGGTAIFQDVFDPDQLLDMMEQAGATRLLSTAPKLAAIVAAQRRRRRPLESLHTVCAGGTTVPAELVPAVEEAFGLPLRAVWGMTEIVVGTVVRADDPPGWTAHSDGYPIDGLQLRVVTPDGKEGTGSLQVRGAPLCLGTVTDDIGQISPTADVADGWFETGDLARPDGRGGIRIMGRVVDRIYGRDAAVMIPVRDVEEELLRHPAVADLAIIACRDGMLEDACAVVVPAGEPPTLDELQEFLRRQGMTESYFPTRLEIVDALPRDQLGKIRKYQLRERFDGPTP